METSTAEGQKQDKMGKFEEKIKKQELGIPNKEKNW